MIRAREGSLAVLVDQVFSSISNLVPLVLAVRSSPPDLAGVIGVLSTLMVLMLGFARGSVSQHLFLPYGAVQPARAEIAGEAFALAALSLPAMFLVGLALRGVAQIPMVVSWAVILSMSIVVDFGRLLALQVRQPRLALKFDAAWFALEVAIFAGLHLLGIAMTSSVAFATWAAGAVLAAALTMSSIHSLNIKIHWGRSVVLSGRRKDLLVEWISDAVLLHGVSIIVAWTLGPREAGMIRIASVVCGPVSVILQGFSLVSLGRAARLGVRLLDVLLPVAAFFALATALSLGDLLVSDRIWHLFLGPSAHAVRPLVRMMLFVTAAMGGARVCASSLRAVGRSAYFSRLYVAASLVTLPFLVLASGGGPSAVIWVLFVCWATLLVAGFREVLLRARFDRDVRAGDYDQVCR